MAPGGGGDGREHGVGSVHGWSIGGLDLDVDRWGVDGAQDPERADREVERRPVVVDREALAAYPAERHVRGAGAVAAEHHLVERITTSDADVQRTVGIDRDRGGRAVRGGDGVDSGVDRAVGDRGEQHRRLGPARGASGARGRRSDHVDLLDHQAGRDRPDRGGDPRCPRDPDDARPVGAHTGRDRGTLRSAPHDVFAGEQDAHRPTVPVGEAPGDSADLGRRPCRRTRRRCRASWPASPPGAHHAASGSRYAGSTQVVCSVRIQAPAGNSIGDRQRRRRAPSLDLAAAAGAPRPAIRPRPTRRRRRAARPARRPARCRRRTHRARARRAPRRPAAPHPPTPPAPPDLSASDAAGRGV